MVTSLITTYYLEKREQRKAELDFCLALNCAAFDRVTVLADGGAVAPNCFYGDWISVSKRPKYNSALQWASEEGLNIIANCDMIIPRFAIAQITQHLTPEQVYCLTRYDLPAMKLWDVDYSQDVWAFLGKLDVGGDYYFGVPGCDNKFAYECRKAGYAPLNPSREIKTYHFHCSGLRTKTNERPSRLNHPFRVPRPYLRVSPTKISEIPSYRA